MKNVLLVRVGLIENLGLFKLRFDEIQSLSSKAHYLDALKNYVVAAQRE